MFRWVDHTAELELEIEASTPEDVFVVALTALAELLASEQERGPEAGTEPGPGVHRRLSAEAEDRPALLAAWMDELVFLAEREGFEPMAVEKLDLGPRSVQATITGRLGQPPPLVKGVTYHRLSFARAGDGYRATVVLDV